MLLRRCSSWGSMVGLVVSLESSFAEKTRVPAGSMSSSSPSSMALKIRAWSPIVMTSPSRRSISASILAPFSKVPFLLPRSTM